MSGCFFFCIAAGFLFRAGCCNPTAKVVNFHETAKVWNDYFL
jgi:hypothetical protein